MWLLPWLMWDELRTLQQTGCIAGLPGTAGGHTHCPSMFTSDGAESTRYHVDALQGWVKSGLILIYLDTGTTTVRPLLL